MHQFWFFIGDFPIRAYGTLFALAFILGVGVTLYFIKAEGKTELMDPMLDLAPILLIGGLLGARFWQVFFFDWSYYRQNPSEILAVWHGGLSIQGGVVGALIVGGLYGGPTGGDFGIIFPVGTIARDTFQDQPLWPAEVWEGQFDVILFAVLVILKLRKWPSGIIFLLYMTLYNLGRFFLENLRGDSARFMFNWTAAQWSSMTAVILAVLLIIWRVLRARDKSSC